MTAFLAFTTGLFGGVLFGIYGKGILKKLSEIMNEKDDEIEVETED